MTPDMSSNAVLAIVARAARDVATVTRVPEVASAFDLLAELTDRAAAITPPAESPTTLDVVPGAMQVIREAGWSGWLSRLPAETRGVHIVGGISALAARTDDNGTERRYDIGRQLTALGKTIDAMSDDDAEVFAARRPGLAKALGALFMAMERGVPPTWS